MAGAVFSTYERPRPRAPQPSSSSAAVAGPSRQSQTQFELQPMMMPAVWRGGGGGGEDAVSLPEGGGAGGEDDEEAEVALPTTRRPRPREMPLSRDAVLDRALPRASHRYGLAQAIARSVTLSLALAGLATALYLVARWREKRGVAGVAIGANGVAIIIDTFMLVDLINTNLPRVSPYAIGGLDFVMLAAALTAGMFVGLSDRGYEDEPAPWRHVMMVAAGLTWATAGVRFVYVIWSYLDWRRVRKTREQMRSSPL